ncbi:unnamed protein product [Symbiodinium sp. KB8]|nr:unnamed protein product [Symbiodinium sp. KB8]
MRQQGYAPTQAELARYAKAAEMGASATDFAAWCRETGYKDPSFEELISFFAPFDPEGSGFVPSRVFRQLLSHGEAFDGKELDAALGEIRAKAGAGGEDLVNYRDFVTLALERCAGWTVGQVASEGRLPSSYSAQQAGEVLLVALPIAEAPQNGPALVAALQQRCRVSGRARRRLRCLADGGGAGRALSPEELAQALYPIPDEVPEPLPEGQAAEGDLQLQEILNHNVLAPSGRFTVWMPEFCSLMKSVRCGSQQRRRGAGCLTEVFVLEGGSAALYGLPSIFNHCCDGQGGSTMKLILTFLDKAMIFTATRDMDAGEELCHRYFDVEGDLAERHGQSTRWEFACRCTRCAFEADILPKSPAADVVHRTVTEFKEELRFEMRALSEALKVPQLLMLVDWDTSQSLTNPPDDDEQAALVMEGDVEQDRKRGEARKGNKARIGGAVAGGDESEDGYDGLGMVKADVEDDGSPRCEVVAGPRGLLVIL